jgi:predicted XRE-type DNA-binding protein
MKGWSATLAARVLGIDEKDLTQKHAACLLGISPSEIQRLLALVEALHEAKRLIEMFGLRDFSTEVGDNNIMRIVGSDISHNVTFYFAL